MITTVDYFQAYDFKAIGERLRKLRQDEMMSAKECAVRIGISRSNYYNIESGVSQNIEISTIKKICALFGITETEFLWGGPEDKLPQAAESVREEQALYLNDIDKKIILTMQGMTDAEKRDILQCVEDKKLLKEIKAKKAG